MNMRQVRKKIKSVVNVRKITKAMQLISAIKMKKAQAMAVDGRPYQDDLIAVLKKVVPQVDVKHSPLLSSCTESQKELVIVITSNKGMCGAFNFNLFRSLSKSIDIKNYDFITVGKKSTSFIFRMGGTIIADYSTDSPLKSVSALFDLLLNKFLNGEYQSISLYYNRFVSILHHEPTKETILPIQFHAEEEKSSEIAREYLIEPSPEKILDFLLKSFVEGRIRDALIQSDAGEQSARMMAMKNATENANDVIYNLTLLRNKLRQEKITSELLDMITAKESVEAS